MKDVGSSANRIESNADGVNQQTVLRVILDASNNLAVQKVFPDQPPPCRASGVITMSIWPTPVRQ